MHGHGAGSGGSAHETSNIGLIRRRNKCKGDDVLPESSPSPLTVQESNFSSLLAKTACMEGTLCNRKGAPSQAAAPATLIPGEPSAFAALPHELFARILNLAVAQGLEHDEQSLESEEQNATTWALCKLVCRQWRDYVRGACSRLVVRSGAGRHDRLRKALQIHPHVVELEIAGGGDLGASTFGRQFTLLSLRALSAVLL